MLTVHDSEAIIQRVLAVGARGYLFKTDVARDLVAAIKAVHGDDTFFSARVADMILASFKTRGANDEHASYGRLTPRQNQAVQLLADGLSSKEVAALLNISIKTAETHRTNIMRRLNCHSVAEIVRYALHNQMIEA
jgi:DNA-binding NarL/FixJ family response regulator